MVWTAKDYIPGHGFRDDVLTWALPENSPIVSDVRLDLAHELEKFVAYVEGIIEFREDVRCELMRAGLC